VALRPKNTNLVSPTNGIERKTWGNELTKQPTEGTVFRCSHCRRRISHMVNQSFRAAQSIKGDRVGRRQGHQGALRKKKNRSQGRAKCASNRRVRTKAAKKGIIGKERGWRGEGKTSNVRRNCASGGNEGEPVCQTPPLGSFLGNAARTMTSNAGHRKKKKKEVKPEIPRRCPAERTAEKSRHGSHLPKLEPRKKISNAG